MGDSMCNVVSRRGVAAEYSNSTACSFGILFLQGKKEKKRGTEQENRGQREYQRIGRVY